MRAIHVFRQKMWVFIVLFIVICAFVLTACGKISTGKGAELTPLPTPTGKISTGKGAEPTPSPTPTSGTVQGYGTAFGCPSDVVVSTAPAPANVTVRPGQGQTTFYAHKDDVIEIQMPFGVAWRGPITSGEVLQLQFPSGYVWKPSNACIWHFVARGVGTAKLTFFGSALCKKPGLCVPSEIFDAFTIKVA